MAILPKSLATAFVAVCAAAVLVACGTENGAESAADPSSESPSSSQSEAPTEIATTPGALPQCADVWVDGETLPADYTACTTDDETIKPVKRMCGFGRPLLEQDGRFYAMKGQQINDVGDLETSDQYQQLLASCQA